MHSAVMQSKTKSKHQQCPELGVLGILVEHMFVERWIAALQIRPHFGTVQNA